MTRRVVPYVLVAAGLVAALFIVLPFFNATSPGSNWEGGLVGETAPAFALNDDAGRQVSVNRYHGEIVLMNLWATWCPPCRAEMPDLQRLSDAYRGRLAIVGVNEGESVERARAFARSLGIAFPIWMDEEQRYGRAYGVLGLPTTVIVGRDGKILRAVDGALSYAQMRAAVSALVGAR